MQIVAEFVTSAAGAGDFPRDRLPEVALVGRSNVGKSSLINALVRRPLARTSAAPGKTRLANFYRVQRGSSPPLFLVDLPGYGYARGGDATSREFDALVDAYFARAAQIGALLLVDSRHPELESDRDTWSWMETLSCPHGIVGTKVDKLTRAERTRHHRVLESLYQQPVPLVSAQSGEGLDELWKKIVSLPRPTAA